MRKTLTALAPIVGKRPSMVKAINAVATPRNVRRVVSPHVTSPVKGERQMPSPIERMIDAACGVPKSERFDRPAPVKLECPKCGAEKMAARDKTDPPNTYIVKLTCPKCHDEGDFQQVDYFNQQGEQIDLSGNPVR
jgi:rubredoxin